MNNWQYSACINVLGLWSAYAKRSWIDKKGVSRLTVIQAQPAKKTQDENNTQLHALEAVKLKISNYKES
jgi:hypothetical protein